MVYEIIDVETMQERILQFCEFLRAHNVSPDHIFDSRLVASELVGNVLKHARGVATLHGTVSDTFVEIHVTSTEKFTPPPISRCSDAYCEHGRGLFLVDSVCEERITTENGILVKIRIR